MTAVMRAAAQGQGPKVLRVGLVQGGRVIEERVIKERTTVTVGASERATFVIATDLVPPRFELFERVGGEYHLRLVPGMTGRVALATGISDLRALGAQAVRTGDVHRVKLTDEARGKVVLGDTTLLFQFVPQPPPATRPQLPLAVRSTPWLDRDLTIIAAISFLLHFGAVGGLYSDWSDPIVDTDVNVQGLIDLAPRLPPAQIDPPAPPDPKTQDATKKDTQPDEKDAKDDRPPTKAPPGPPAPKPPMSDHDAALLAARAEAIGIGIVASTKGSSVIDAALARGNVPVVDMTKAAESNAAVESAGDFHTGGVGYVAAGKRGLDGIAGGVGIGAKNGAGPVANVPGPKATADIGPLAPSAPVRDLERVVAGLRPRFRACYETRGLAVDPSMAGSVTIAVKIEPNGEVKSADPSGVAGLSEPVVTCIARVLRNATFDGPGSSGSLVQVPVKFLKQ